MKDEFPTLNKHDSTIGHNRKRLSLAPAACPPPIPPHFCPPPALLPTRRRVPNLRASPTTAIATAETAAQLHIPFINRAILPRILRFLHFLPSSSGHVQRPRNFDVPVMIL